MPRLLSAIPLIVAAAAHAGWEHAGPGGGEVANFHVDGNYILASTPGGFLRSLDGGGTWSFAKSPPSVVLDLAVFGSTALTVPGFASDDPGNWISRDSARTWTHLQAPDGLGGPSWLFEVPRLAFAYGRYGLMVGNLILRSGDQGATWSPAAIPDSQVQSPASIAEAGGILYIGTGAGFLRSSDSGATWIRVGSLPSAPGTSGYNAAQGIAGNDTALLAIGAYQTGGGYSYYRSTDHAETWIPAGSVVGRYNSLVRSGQDLFASREEAIWRTPDCGLTWIRMGRLESPVLELKASGEYLYAGTTANGLFRSRDRGATWTSLRIPNGRIGTLYAESGVLFTASARDMYLHRSVDRGSVWESTLPWEGVDYYLPAPGRQIGGIAGNLFAVNSQMGTLQRSSDFGAHWDAFPDRSFLRVERVGERLFGYAETGDSGLADLDEYVDSLKAWQRISISRYRPEAVLGRALLSDFGAVSFDQGTSWSNYVPRNVAARIVTVCGQDVFLASDSGLFRSPDTGKSWSFLRSTPRNIWSLRGYGSDLIAGVGDLYGSGAESPGGILVSRDKGATWVPAGEGLPPFSVVALVPSGPDLWVGLNGGGLWRRPLSEILPGNVSVEGKARRRAAMPAVPARSAYDATGRRAGLRGPALAAPPKLR
jgi:photosystem II stability/assembly factor-like uncharacterized protein